MYLRQPDVTDGGTEIASTSTKIKCFNYFAWVKPLRALSLLALEFATSSDQTCWPVPTFLLQLFGAVPVSGMEGSDSPLPFLQDWWPLDCLTFLPRTYFWAHNILRMRQWGSKGCLQLVQCWKQWPDFIPFGENLLTEWGGFISLLVEVFLIRKCLQDSQVISKYCPVENQWLLRHQQWCCFQAKLVKLKILSGWPLFPPY